MNQPMRTVLILLLGMAALTLTQPSLAQECDPKWSRGLFGSQDLMNTVNAFVTWDDGTGEALYVGGWFTTADGQSIRYIAKWDGTTWSPLGTQPNSFVLALAVFDDGTGQALYAAGRFATIGGVTANYIAKWDGAVWSPLGAGVNYFVNALTVFDDGNGPALYAAGEFTIAGGVIANRVAKWDGVDWSPLRTGMETSVFALTVFDDGSGPALYAGGDFTTAGEVFVNNIAKWDGAVWSPLSGPGGTGINGFVVSMTVFDDGNGPALYAGGGFLTAGGQTAICIARWDGSDWSPLIGPDGNGMNAFVNTLTVFDDGNGPALYADGNFTQAGGVAISRIAKWNGSRWSRLTPGGFDNTVNALGGFDDGSGASLYAGGLFTEAGGQSISYIAKLDRGTWSPLTGPGNAGLDARVFALEEFDDGSGSALYAGGSFISAGGQIVNRIAKWDGVAWSPLVGPNGTGVDATIDALAVFDDGSGPALYAAGVFTTAGGVSVNRIAKWDGTAWSALAGQGTGVNDRVFALAVYDDGSGPALYAGGDFTTAGGVTVNRVAKWNGSEWSALAGPGTGVNDRVQALAVFDDGTGPALYAGGTFTTAGGVSANRIARWDGTVWSALSTGVNGTVIDLTVFDDGSGPALYAGGLFITAGGVTVNRIAKWNGTAWSPLLRPSGTGINGTVGSLAVFDDGKGPALYAGGGFTIAGGVESIRIAKRQGCSVTPPVCLGDIAKWQGCPITPPVCLGDIADSNGTLGNADGQVDFGDLLALFGLAGPCPGGTPGCTGDIADSNGTLGNADGQVDFGDLLALFGLAGPCP